MPYIQPQFPEIEAPLRELVQQHRRIADEPLHLALAYNAGREQEHVFVFELIGNFGADLVDPERRIFETTFAGAQVFPAGGRRPNLRLLLTNPTELQEALRERWPAIEELRKAVASQNYGLDAGRVG